ncbi:hypothetical protein AAG747_15360 [Rapidithrix thailandica]|uniref:Uncharacterized protein n=1 Tax=Rapidithrix thailandica TaxID=413964 RepID=A0AAW9S8F6_9BACT
MYHTINNFLEFKFTLAYMFLQSQATLTNPDTIGYLVEKAIAIAVLIWIVHDLKKSKKETSEANLKEVQELRKEHREEMQAQREGYEKYVEYMARVHKEQMEMLKNILKDESK